MVRKLSVTFFALLFLQVCSAQQKDSLAIDSTFYDYEELFSELDNLLDSLSRPRSFVLVNLNIGQRITSYETKTTGTNSLRKNIVYTPSLGYYHHSGIGLTTGASFMNDAEKLRPLQYSLTGSFDYQKQKKFITGFSYTHFFTKENLSFYTSPLENEVYTYFTYRNWWIRPTIAVSYGWGKRENFEEVEERIRNINLSRRGFTRINTHEKVADLNLFTSVRHDFYFLRALGSDYIRLTPQISFVSGSQQFGFNQVTNSYATVRRTGRNILYYSDQQSFDDQFYFQPISLTTFLKTEYASGKFYVQPQLMLDYYFPTSDSHFSTAFFLNLGFVF